MKKGNCDQSFSRSRCGTVVIVVIIAHGHFLQGLTGGIIPHRTRGDSHHYLLHLNSQHTSCAIQHVPQKTSTGRLGTVRLVSESSTFFFKKKKKPNRHSKITIRTGVCTATHFHAHFSAFRFQTHLEAQRTRRALFDQKAGLSKSLHQVILFLACLTRAQRTPHSRVGHPVTSLSHSFAFSPRCLAARTFHRQTHISAGCSLLSAGAKWPGCPEKVKLLRLLQGCCFLVDVAHFVPRLRSLSCRGSKKARTYSHPSTTAPWVRLRPMVSMASTTLFDWCMRRRVEDSRF